MIQLLVWTVKRSSKVEKRVRERSIKRLCLWFDEETGATCDCESVSRGQCRKHINSTNHQLRNMPTKSSRAELAANEIRIGRLLDRDEQRVYRRMATSPIVRSAVEVTGV